MQVVLVHWVFSAVTLELKLKSRLVAAHGFTAHRAGCAHPRSAPHAVRPSRRQPPAADRVAGFFAKDGVVRNCRGSQSHGRRSEPDATRPDARVRHLGARWKAIQRTPHRKVALPVGVREREPGTVSACSRAADPRDDLLTLRDGLPAAIADVPVTGNDPDIDCSGSWQAALVQLLPDSLASAAGKEARRGARRR